MKIAVYCGSTPGAQEAFGESAEALGKWIGKNGHTLVYGGSNTGLMGIVADAVLDNGGGAIGVQVDVPLIQSRKHSRLTESIETDTMAERKAKMMELADAFIALPGGIGTLDEVTEILCLQNLGMVSAPIVFFDVNGYYRPVKAVFDAMLSNEFCKAECFDSVLFSDQLEEISGFISKART